MGVDFQGREHHHLFFIIISAFLSIGSDLNSEQPIFVIEIDYK